jgi:cytochrome b561
MKTGTRSMPKPDLSPSQTAWRYGRTAVVLHWTLAVLLVATTALGFYMMSVEKEPGADAYFNLHMSIGIVIALLVITRIVWRLTHPPQPLPASVPRWQVWLAGATQASIYLLVVLMPLTGYLGASHSKAGVPLFGLATPRWTAPDHDTAESFYTIHSVLIWVLIFLVALHVAGALKDLLIDRDGVFQRMWFRSRHRTASPPPP